MRCSPFSLLTDGLNDTGLEKIPLTVRIYDVNTSRTESRFLDMCLMKGSDSATASSIFQKIDDALSLHGISWINCVGFGVHNTNVNLNWWQKFNQDKSKKKSPSYYLVAWPCHLILNTVCKASEMIFSGTSEFSLEDMLLTYTIILTRALSGNRC